MSAGVAFASETLWSHGLDDRALESGLELALEHLSISRSAAVVGGTKREKVQAWARFDCDPEHQWTRNPSVRFGRAWTCITR